MRVRERGAARLGTLLALGLLLLGGMLLVMLRDTNREGSPAPEELELQSARRPATPELDEDPKSTTRKEFTPDALGLARPEQDLSLNDSGQRRSTAQDRFSGRGRIRGAVSMKDQSALPAQWTLIARPSKMLFGAEFAQEQQLEFSNGETRFELDDLPMGSYDILAQSAIGNALAMQVILDRENPSPFLSIQMQPAGDLDGRLLDHAGSPASLVPIVLQSLLDQTQRRILTDELGRFRYPKVLDGTYQLTVGEFENPIMPKSKTLRLQAPGMTLPDILLPTLATLDLHIVNESKENLSDVIVRGAGHNGGSIDARTDIFGTLRIKHLPAGRYRLSFQCEGYRVRRSPIDLKLDQDNAYLIELLQE